MKHHATNLENHYAVSTSSLGDQVLVQLQEKGEQVRIPLTPDEARHMAVLLLQAAHKIETKKDET